MKYIINKKFVIKIMLSFLIKDEGFFGFRCSTYFSIHVEHNLKMSVYCFKNSKFNRGAKNMVVWLGYYDRFENIKLA